MTEHPFSRDSDAGFKIFGKYAIKHSDGTPLHGKKYFVLRLDSDLPEERVSVSAAMNAYLGNEMKNILSMLDRCHTFLSDICRDSSLSSGCFACTGASDLADDIYVILHPEEYMPESVNENKV